MSTTAQPAANLTPAIREDAGPRPLTAPTRQRSDQEADAVALARAARARIQPAPFDKDGIYRETLTNLKLAIRRNWPSEAQFCQEVGIDQQYLSKCWPKSGQPIGREMGVGLFSRICLALGLLDNCEVSDEQLLMRSSLREYLLVNNNSLMRSTVRLADLAL